MRRLQRRVGIGTAIRVAAALGGGGLVWRFIMHDGGALVLCAGLLLFAFALFMRARPMVKTADEEASELGALVVHNGGTFIPSEGAAYPDAQIFVFRERLLIFGCREEPVSEIPLARVGSYTARPWSSGAARDESLDERLVARILPQAEVGHLFLQCRLRGEDKTLFAAVFEDVLDLRDIPFLNDRVGRDVGRARHARADELEVVEHALDDRGVRHGSSAVHCQRIEADNEAVEIL
jgi:hypothetical protein